SLVKRSEQLDIAIHDTIYVTDILTSGNTVFGAYGFDVNDGKRYLIHADAVILAAGGHSRIWRRTSSRRDENTGDSFRLAVEAGARLRDPELVQNSSSSTHPASSNQKMRRAHSSQKQPAVRVAFCATPWGNGSWNATTQSEWNCRLVTG